MEKFTTSNEMVPFQDPITNITDLCTQCLLTLFSYLNVSDLVNLVEANIVSKLGKRNEKKLHYQQSIVKAFQIKVKMNERKTSVTANARSAPKHIKMLRSFGREIESLIVYCQANYARYNGMNSQDFQNRRYERALEDAIIENCSETLTGISFDKCNVDTMKELDRPFNNVNLVAFYGCHVGSTLGQLKKWFPEVEVLNFTDTYVFDAKCIHKHFPDLKSLTVLNDSQHGVEKGKMIFSNLNLEVFVQLNPQVKTLHIRHDNVYQLDSDGSNAIIVDWDLITLISNNLKLTKLKLDLEKFRFESEWQSTVALDSLITLDVECSDCHYLSTIRITSAQLNELNLQISNWSSDTQIDYEAIATFVVRAAPKQLKIISAYGTFDVDNDQVIKMTQHLPQLQELYIECEWCSDLPNAVVNLLVNGGGALDKLIGVFNFHGDDNGNAPPEYLQMRQGFHDKIIRNGFVTGKWSFKFQYKDDPDYYIDTIEFKKIK